jgi:hypothetical protein
MRMVDRGDLIAQCNLTALPALKPDQFTSLGEFQKDVQRSLGKSFGRFVQASESVNSQGHHIHSVLVEGTVSELSINWHYYLVSDEAGHRATFAFTLEEDLSDRLGTSDARMVNSLQFALDEATPQPTAAKKRALK